jgi:hypothetical protein
MADIESIDGSIGWVSLSEIANVFQEYNRQLDKHVWPEQGRALRGEVLKHFESAKYELMKRAKRNYLDYLKTAPGSVLPPRPTGPDGKDARAARLARMRSRPSDGGV